MDLIKIVTDLLTENGIHCCQSFPNGRMPILEEPAVMVGRNGRAMTPVAITNYLGCRGDDSASAALCREEIFLHVYSPYLWGGRFCDRTTDRVLSVILKNIDVGMFEQIRQTINHYDAKTDCFRSEIYITVPMWVQLSSQ